MRMLPDKGRWRMKITRYVSDRHIQTFKEDWETDPGQAKSHAVKWLIDRSVSKKAQPSYRIRGGFVYPVEIDIKDIPEGRLENDYEYGPIKEGNKMAPTRTIKLVVYNYGERRKDKNIRFTTYLKTWYEEEFFVGIYRAVRKELRLSIGSSILPEEVIDIMIERGYCKDPIKAEKEYIVDGK